MPIKKCKKCENDRYANTSWCIVHFKEHEKEKQMKKREKDLKIITVKKKTNQQIKKTIHDRVWKLMSKAVRLKGVDKQGNNRCYTCDVIKPWQELQAGHFKHDRLDFDFRNLKGQCSRCNKWLSGRLDVYAERLIRDYGLKWFNKLVKDAWSHKGYSIEEMLKIEEDLKKQIQEYEKNSK